MRTKDSIQREGDRCGMRRGLTASIVVTINVGNVNEAPEFPSTGTGAHTVRSAENTPANQDFGAPVAGHR